MSLKRVLDLRARGNSSMEVSLASRPVAASTFGGKSGRDTSKLALGSQTKYTTGSTKGMKASRVLGTQLYSTMADSFDSPVELGDVHLDGIKRDVKPYSSPDTLLSDKKHDHDGVNIEVEKSVT